MKERLLKHRIAIDVALKNEAKRYLHNWLDVCLTPKLYREEENYRQDLEFWAKEIRDLIDARACLEEMWNERL